MRKIEGSDAFFCADRDGAEISADEIREVIRLFSAGEIPDCQMSAFAMAILFRGMSDDETWHLTEAMMRSGQVLEYPADSPTKGGQALHRRDRGQYLAPLLACDELWVPMISGRGLGITGGTLYTLESLPGFDVHLDVPRALRQLERIGVS